MPAETLRSRHSSWPGLALAVVAVIVAAAIYFFIPATEPPRDLTLAPDPDRGDYIIRLGACITCHTDKENGGRPLAGGGPLKTRFGTFYAPNITPDKETGLGNWTLRQFSDAISNGTGPDGSNLYLVFPYTFLTRMSDQDVVDLYAALMRRDAVRNTPPTNDIPFPFNLRLLVSGWKTLFFDPHRYRPDPSRSEQWNRGRYLATGIGHCILCHSPRNTFGAVREDRAFQGNPVDGPGGKAPPITELALAADGFTEESLADMLKTGITVNAGEIGNEMADVIQDETSHWTAADRRAVAHYLMNRQERARNAAEAIAVVDRFRPASLRNRNPTGASTQP